MTDVTNKNEVCYYHFDGTYNSYDCENRLLQVKQGGNTIAEYKYDFAGRRIRKTAGTTTTRYCYDGDQIIADYNDSGVLQRRYVYGPGIDEPLFMIAGLNTYYYYFDGLGSVVALAKSGYAPSEIYSYDVFGEPNRTSAVGNRYMFTGREYDSETGLYYYRARYYKPSIGRFLQTDPIGSEAGLGLYTYALNNPVKYSDPYGQWPIWSCIKCWRELGRHMGECRCGHVCDQYSNDYDAYCDCMLNQRPQCQRDCMNRLRRTLKSCIECDGESYII